MADERKYYVLCSSNCKFESMTKEQILTAIEQAITTGEITNVDSGFVTTVKEQNAAAGIKFWFGTQAEYNAQVESGVDFANVFCIFSDDTTEEDLYNALAEIKTSVEELGENFAVEDGEKEIDGIKWRFKKWNNGECELFGYTAFVLTKLTRLSDGCCISELLRVSFPFTVKDRVVVGTADNLSIITNVGSGGAYATSDLRILTHMPVTDEELASKDFSKTVNVNLIVKGSWK